jgi:DNA-binding NtrC family response regulator
MYNEQYKKSLEKLSPKTMKLLMEYHWPGNIRELENMIKRMVVLGSEQTVLQELSQSKPSSMIAADHEELDLASLGVDFSNDQELDLKAISKRASQIAEKKVIERVLGQTRWNRKEAAERLKISYKALLYKMKENGLSEGR